MLSPLTSNIFFAALLLAAPQRFSEGVVDPADVIHLEDQHVDVARIRGTGIYVGVIVDVGVDDGELR